jgi:hypothetical protein
MGEGVLVASLMLEAFSEAIAADAKIVTRNVGKCRSWPGISRGFWQSSEIMRCVHILDISCRNSLNWAFRLRQAHAAYR